MDISDDTMLKMMSPDTKMMMPPDPRMMMSPDPKMMMPPDPKMMMPPDPKMMMPPDPKMMMPLDPKMMMPLDPKMMMPPDPKMMMPPDPKMMMPPDPKMMMPPDPKMMMSNMRISPDPKMMLPDMRMMVPDPRLMPPDLKIPPPGIGMIPPDLKMPPPGIGLMPPDLKMPPPGIGMIPPDFHMPHNLQMMPSDMQLPPDLKMVPPGLKMMPPGPKRMRNSMDKASPKQPLPCDECHKTFKFRSLLVAHKKSAHTVPKPFKCKVCPKTFKKETYLQIHERIHDDRTSVTCNICFQKFPYISKLRIHQQSHLKTRTNVNFPENFPPHVVPQDSNAIVYNSSETPAMPDHMEPKVKSEVTEGIPSPTATSPEKLLAPQTADAHIPEGNASFLKMPDTGMSQDIKTEPVANKTNNLDPTQPPSNTTGTKSKGKVPKPYKCSLCPKAFKKDAYLQIHVRIHDERTVCICNICFKPFPQKGKLRAHQRLTHFRDKPYVRIPKRPISDAKHFVQKSSRGQINVSNPDLPENRTNDFGEQHATPPPSADSPIRKRKKKLCNNISPQSMCSVQVTTEDGVETKICDICHKPYIESSNGFQQCSGAVCYLCDRTFPSMGELDKHIMEHKTQKNYPCHLCEKRFLENSELKEHFSKHTADGYYFCHFCNQSFTQEKVLDAHVVQHILEQNFFCQFCNKCFLQQSDLDAHLTDHIVNENYPCEHCGLLLLSSADLEEHLAGHKEKNEDSHQNPLS